MLPFSSRYAQLVTLQALSKNKSVESLHLNNNQLTDASLLMLVELAKCNKVLKKVNLGQNKTTPKMNKEIAKQLKDSYGVTLTI